MKRPRKAFELATLDSDAKVRALLIARLTKLAETAPVALLHTIVQGLEMEASTR